MVMAMVMVNVDLYSASSQKSLMRSNNDYIMITESVKDDLR